eukprot:TRINITY_DN10158_c0_g1_i1.p1 TRINITY_DN10158_c0_g1~~TRINITY_DN10158_c0_g1_i1.p1  ORF type:complete len:198 (+),score=65.77 TRINITY_DN10158_c0_g1_i1:42-596(+)
MLRSLARRSIVPSSTPVRFYSRRDKLHVKTTFVKEPFTVDVALEDPSFGSIPADSPLFGPKPRKGHRKRPSPYLRLSKDSAMWKQYYEGNEEMDNMEKQRIALLKMRVQKKRMSNTLDDQAQLDGSKTVGGVKVWRSQGETMRENMADKLAAKADIAAERQAMEAARAAEKAEAKKTGGAGEEN